MSKVIVIDCGVLTHKAIFSWGSVKQKILNGILPKEHFLPPVSYTFFLMLLGSLKRIGVNKDDTIILALDNTTSWRKFFYPLYKAQRKDFRDSHKLIDWKHHYAMINKVIEQIKESTDWHIMWLPNLFNGADLALTEQGGDLVNETEADLDRTYGAEADDILAYATKYYSDKEVIMVSIDADLDQLCVKDNVKFFTLMIKYRGGTGVYKVIDNGYKVLSKKIEKGDKSDNIIPGETDDNSEKAQKQRELIIDLINLPPFLEEKLKPVFDNLSNSQLILDKLPFQNSLAKKFIDIYKKDKIITYEDSVKRLERKKVRTKNKKKKIKKESTMREI